MGGRGGPSSLPTRPGPLLPLASPHSARARVSFPHVTGEIGPPVETLCLAPCQPCSASSTLHRALLSPEGAWPLSWARSPADPGPPPEHPAVPSGPGILEPGGRRREPACPSRVLLSPGHLVGTLFLSLSLAGLRPAPLGLDTQVVFSFRFYHGKHFATFPPSQNKQDLDGRGSFNGRSRFSVENGG